MSVLYILEFDLFRYQVPWNGGSMNCATSAPDVS